MGRNKVKTLKKYKEHKANFKNFLVSWEFSRVRTFCLGVTVLLI